MVRGHSGTVHETEFTLRFALWYLCVLFGFFHGRKIAFEIFHRAQFFWDQLSTPMILVSRTVQVSASKSTIIK